MFNGKPISRPRKRYHLLELGNGYIIHDKLDPDHECRGFMLMPDMYERKNIVEKGYKSPQDLVDRLNELDLTANGKLYDTSFLTLKDDAFDDLKPRINNLLSEAVEGFPQSCTCTIVNMNNRREIPDEYTVKITVNKGQDLGILQDPVFDDTMMVINRYIDDLTESEKPVGESVLTELKMRLMEHFQLKNQLKRMRNPEYDPRHLRDYI